MRNSYRQLNRSKKVQDIIQKEIFDKNYPSLEALAKALSDSGSREFFEKYVDKQMVEIAGTLPF